MLPAFAAKITRQVKLLLQGSPISYRYWPEGITFNHPGINFRTDMEKLASIAKDFEATHGRDRGYGWMLERPIKFLGLYKQARYPPMVRERNRSFLAFLSTLQVKESASSVLGQMEARGILERIYAFAVPGIKEETDEEV